MAFDRPLATTSANLGVASGPYSMQNSIELGGKNAALWQEHLEQIGTTAVPQPDAPNSVPVGGFAAEASQQNAPLPNAATSTNTATDRQDNRSKDGNERDRESRTGRDVSDRQVHFHSTSPRLNDSSY